VIGRPNIELRQLTFPPAPDDELPEMVRFQAMREFNALEDDWPLDFVPLDDQPDQPRNVLAAAVDPDTVDQIRQVCQGAGLKPKRLVLRPCAAASLLCRVHPADPAKVRLLVDLVADEADLTVMIDRKVMFLRTARLPGDPLAQQEQVQALLAEIRRTMAAAQNQLGGRRAESIMLCGTADRHRELAASIEESLGTPAELFDPFSGLQLGPELRAALPDHPPHFAPLLGMLLDELDQREQAIDFLNPRRPSKPPSRRKTYVLAALAVAAVVGLVYLGGRLQRSRLRAEIETLRAQSKSWDKPVAAATKLRKAEAEIEEWMAGEVVWLDKIHRLSEKFPPAREAMLTQLAAGPSSRGGEMRLEGLTRSATTIDEMERGLRSPSYRVEGKGRSQDDSHKFYSWRFNSSLFVNPKEQ